MKTITKITFATILLIAISVIFSGCSSSGKAKESSQENTLTMSASAIELKEDMRKLWEDHIVWTRNVIFCIMDDLKGKDQAVNRLLRNQNDIGNAIKPYYGEIAGNDLTNLLHTHVTTAAEFLVAAKTGDMKAYDGIKTKWHNNAEDISTFLNKTNSNWQMKMMMHDHLNLTEVEVVARKNKNFDEDVVAYDMVHDEILKMADFLSDGIIKQFPDKFKEPMLKM